MRDVLQSLIPLAVALVLVGPVHAARSADEARAILKDTEGAQVGEVRLLSGPNGTLLRADLEGFPEGEHAFHVHAVGQCTPPFKSAGGHFNPTKVKHGFLSGGGYHVGDMPNIHVPASGDLKAEVFNPRLRLGSELFDDDGAALIIHKGPDDYMTDPAGAAGPRIACGVIRR